jgi:hypothetical protein
MLKFPPNRDNFEQMLQDYFESFQPWLQSEVMKLGVKIYSDPVSSASPEDANKWATVLYEVRELNFKYIVLAIVVSFTSLHNRM